MTGASKVAHVAFVAIAALAAATTANAVDIGQIKVSKGDVAIERGGQTLPAGVGAHLQTADVIKTGAAGSVGITMSDNSLLSAGPNSVLSLDKYAFDATTNQGQFDASLRKGSPQTMAVCTSQGETVTRARAPAINPVFRHWRQP